MKIRQPEQHLFTERLMHWHRTANHRSLPWKGERDPYKIWLSEIILQQTRAEQGLPYYLKFAGTYPTVKHLANATDEAAYKLWQGLGYYNRCKNMLSTARQVVQERGGEFPDTYEGLLALKGIGPYTAAAIASFAYGLPQAVVDGNVNRVLARCFGIDTPIDSTEGKKEFQQLATELLYAEDSAAYNQAIMDHGATICTPALPKCSECPLTPDCFAFNKNLIAILPVKSKKAAVRLRYFHYLLLRRDDQLWLQKRTGKDIWQNLYQPYLIESATALDSRELQQTEAFKALNITTAPEYEGALKQRLTHQLIETRPLPDGAWVPLNKLKNYAFPGTLVSFFEKKDYF
jgi:A/G-specific adenine glycosylase